MCRAIISTSCFQIFINFWCLTPLSIALYDLQWQHRSCWVLCWVCGVLVYHLCGGPPKSQIHQRPYDQTEVRSITRYSNLPAHLAVLKKLNACADVSCDSCYRNILMDKMISIHQYALHAFYTVRISLKITMVSLLLFSRRLCCVESEADVLSYPQTRATETLLWDMWPAYLSGLPTHQA